MSFIVLLPKNVPHGWHRDVVPLNMLASQARGLHRNAWVKDHAFLPLMEKIQGSAT